MKTPSIPLLVLLALSAAQTTSPTRAAPITDASYFNSISHTHLTFEQNGAGVTFAPVLASQTLLSTEYAGQGVSFLPSTRLSRDNDSCFRFVQDFAGGS